MKRCRFQQKLPVVALEDVTGGKSLVLSHRRLSVSSATDEPWFLREFCLVD